MVSKYLIYGLVDPRDGQLRYVGLHVGDIRKRLREHLCHARKGKKIYVYDWMRQILKAGLLPEIEVLEICDTSEAMVEAEIWHIAYWKSLGCRLTNLTVGGEGTFGYKHSPESIEKMRISSSGRPRTSGQIEAAQRRRVLTPEQEKVAVELYEKGAACESIGVELGITGGGVRKILMRNEVRLKPAWREKTKRSVLCKLTLDQENEIVALYGPEISTIDLADRFDVTNTIVRDCLNRRGVKMTKFGRISKKRKPIVDQDGVVYLSTGDAAKKLNISPSTILKCLKGRRGPIRGFSFSYAVSLVGG